MARTASATVLKTGTLPSNVWPPFPGVTPATTLVPYSIIWRAWNDPSRPVMPWMTRRVAPSAKTLTRPPAPAATTRCTASSMSLSAVIPTSLRIRIASASLVPVRRMTIGTFTLNCRVAATMPLATSSVRVMPPKMLKRIAFTWGSAVMILSALMTFSGLELPPMSRKLAGSPP